jgi:hypothetical protein
MSIILNICVPILSAIGSYLLWDPYLNDYTIDYQFIIIFLIYLLAVVPSTMYSEHIKSKYQIPNQKKTIIFNGKKFKKNSFNPIKEIPTKGILLGFIIAVASFGSFTILFLFSDIIPAIFGWK